MKADKNENCRHRIRDIYIKKKTRSLCKTKREMKLVLMYLQSIDDAFV